MSTAIFTFDHGQKKLHKAIGVKEQYLDDLSDKIRDVVVELKCNEDGRTINDISPSQVVEIMLNELSYSQLVIMSSFFVLNKIEEIEKKSDEDREFDVMTSDEVPEHIKDILRDVKGRNISSMDDIPENARIKLAEFLKKLRNRD